VKQNSTGAINFKSECIKTYLITKPEFFSFLVLFFLFFISRRLRGKKRKNEQKEMNFKHGKTDKILKLVQDDKIKLILNIENKKKQNNKTK